MSEKKVQTEEKKEILITKEIKTNMPNNQNEEEVQKEEQNLENGEEQDEGEEYKVEEGGEEEGYYNAEDGGEEANHNVEDIEKKEENLDKGGDNMKEIEGGEKNKIEKNGENQKQTQSKEGIEQKEIEENNTEKIQNEEINNENNKLNQAQQQNYEENKKEIIDKNENNNQEKEEKEQIKTSEEKEKVNLEEQKEKEKEKEKEKNNQSQEKKNEGIEKKIDNSKNEMELSKDKEKESETEKDKKININKSNDLTSIKNSESTKKDNQISNKNDKKEINIQTAQKKGEKDLLEENNRTRHIFRSNDKNSNESEQNDPSSRKKNYQFFCSVVTKKNQTNTTGDINKKPIISQPISKPITNLSKNTQVQNTRSNITKITNVTNVIQPKTQPQIQQKKRNAPQIQISIQNKYLVKNEPKKYEPSKQSKITTNIIHTRSENQRKSQPKETQVHTITQNKYERKYEPYKTINKISITNTSYTNTNPNTSNNNNRKIYDNRTSSTNQNKGEPKLKYYARCPNCGYHLNDERDVNMFYRNNTSEKNPNLGNRKANYGNYENKTYFRIDKKDIMSPTKNYNTSNYRRQIDYNQKTNVQNSARNLKKGKGFILPSNNIMFFESTGNSKKLYQRK